MELFKLNSDSNKKFSFTADSKALLEAIAKTSVVTAFSGSAEIGKNHFIVAHGGKIYVAGHSSDTFAACIIDATSVKGSGSFCFTTSQLQGVFKNRGEMNFEYTGHSLTFTAVKGRYKGDLPIQNITADLVHQVTALTKVKESNAVPVKGELLKHIRYGLQNASIKPAYKDDTTSVVAYINCEKDQLSVTSYDNFHVAYYSTEIKSKNSFKLAVHTTILSVVDKFFGDDDKNVKFLFQANGFRAETDSYLVVLPQVQVSDKSAFELVPSYISGLKKPNGRVVFNDDFLGALDNLVTLANGDNNKLEIQLSEKSATIKIKTNSGEASDAVKLVSSKLKSDKFKFRVDPVVLMDLARFMRGKKEVPFNIHNIGDGENTTSCYTVNLDLGDAKLVLIGYYLPA